MQCFLNIKDRVLKNYKFGPLRSLEPEILTKTSVLSFLGLSLTACSHGSESSSPHTTVVASAPSTLPPPIASKKPMPSNPNPANLPSYLITLSEADCARFLQQAQFSSTPQEITELKAIGIEQWLNNQIAMPIAVKGYDWSLNEYNKYYSLNNQEYPSSNYPKYAQPMIYSQLITQPDQLRKRVALALTEVFVVSHVGVNLQYISAAIASYWDVLNRNAFGNFRTLLGDVTFHTLMGDFLNTLGNVKANPKTGMQADENYAREVMQLFSIGLFELNIDGSPVLSGDNRAIETYNNDTITNLAKVFTGLEIDSIDKLPSTLANPGLHLLPMRVNPNTHDTSPKMIFGKMIPAGQSGKDEINNALDILFNHKNVGPFISKKLIQRLTTSNPSPSYIQRVATVFNNNGSGIRGDMAAVIKSILMDVEARVPNPNDPYAGKVREPMVTWVQWLRTFTNKTSQTGHWTLLATDSNLDALSQSPFKSPSVFNFFEPDYIPSSPTFANNSKVTPEMYLVTENAIAAYQNFFMNFYARGGVWSSTSNNIMELLANYDEYLPLVNQPQQLVDKINLVLAAGKLNPTTTAVITNAIHTIPKDDKYPYNAVNMAAFLTVISPSYRVQA